MILSSHAFAEMEERVGRVMSRVLVEDPQNNRTNNASNNANDAAGDLPRPKRTATEETQSETLMENLREEAKGRRKSHDIPAYVDYVGANPLHP